MLQQSLDTVFHALADETRRSIVERLTAGAKPVSELAAPYAMSLSAVVQHIQLLEAAGLVASTKQGRVRSVTLVPATLVGAEKWFEKHLARWNTRLDRLGVLLDDDEAEPKETLRRVLPKENRNPKKTVRSRTTKRRK